MNKPDMLQYAIEALEHAVQWNGIAHLGAEKAKALLDKLHRMGKEMDSLSNRLSLLQDVVWEREVGG